MTTHTTHHDALRWPATDLGRRAITLAGMCVGAVAVLVLGFAVNVVQPAESYTESWPQLVWGVGIWACGLGAVLAGGVAMVRHHERSWMVALATVVGLLPLVLLLSEIALGNF